MNEIVQLVKIFTEDLVRFKKLLDTFNIDNMDQ